MNQCNSPGCEKEAIVSVNLSIGFTRLQMGADTNQDLDGYYCSKHARERWEQFVRKMNDVFMEYPF